MATQQTLSGESASQGFPAGFSLDRRLRILCGGVGLALMVFAGISAIHDGPNAVAVVAFILGAAFFFLGLVGRFRRVTVEGAGARFSVEPDYNLPREPEIEQVRRVAAPEGGNSAEQGIISEDVSRPNAADQQTRPSLIVQAFDAWDERDYAGFDSKVREAIAAEPDDARKVGLDSFRLRFLYRAGQVDKLDELRALRREHPESHSPVMAIGECYESVGEYEKAVQIYSEGFQSSEISEDGRLTLLSSLAQALREVKRFDEAERQLLKGFEIAASDEAKARVHESLSELYGDWGKVDQKHWHLEKALEANPGDAFTRFDLAHSYAANGWPLVALYHYDIVGRAQRDHSAELNNMALILGDHLDMPITAVHHYRSAIELGSSLAAANLARDAAKAGLVREAREILDKPLKQDEINEQVHRASSAISGWLNEEAERLPRILDGARAERLLLLRRMELEQRSRDALKPEDIEGTWETSFASMTFEPKGTTVRVTFRERGALWDWELIGRVTGRIVDFTWSNDHRSQNHEGDGYFMFSGDDEFEGIIRHTPTKGEVKVVTGRRKESQASSGERTRLRPPTLEGLPKFRDFISGE